MKTDPIIIGVGVIIINEDNKILVGKRICKRFPYHSIPGGKVDQGESFEQTAIREIKEETNLTIVTPHVVCIVNNLKSYQDSGLHCISVILVTTKFTGELKLLEPTKCEGWQWVDPLDLPQPHFEPSEVGIMNYLQKRFY